MGKPNNKQPKSNQAGNSKDAKKKGEKPVVAKVKTVKEKGPRPASYVPSTKPEERRQTQIQQQLARQVNEAKVLFTPLVAGVHGIYLVGHNTADHTEAHTFEVKEIVLPITDDKAEKKFLAIEEVREDGRRIFIQHEWLFHPTESCFYAKGFIGEVQYGMLCFLQRTLCAEIKKMKHARWVAREAAREEAEAQERVQSAVVAAPAIVTTKNSVVVPIQDAIWQRDCLPISNLVKDNCFGLYNMSDEEGTLIVELRAGKTDNEFVVKKITPTHPLSAFLLESSVIRVNGISYHAPEFDEHVRGLLALHGIRLKNVKPRHDKRALVTEGLPNVEEETLLAA